MKKILMVLALAISCCATSPLRIVEKGNIKRVSFKGALNLNYYLDIENMICWLRQSGETELLPEEKCKMLISKYKHLWTESNEQIR